MISKRAIQRFLDRKLDSFDWLKGQPEAALTAALSELNPPPDFGTIKPWLHQKQCFLILNQLQRFMLHIDMGGGKTLLSLMLLKYRKQRGEHPKAIVFVPYITSVSTWVDEVAKHAPDLRCVPLIGTTDDNYNTLNGGSGGGVFDLAIICYQSAVAMVTFDDPQGGWNLEAKEVRRIFAQFDTVIFDEIHKCKSASSLTYRMCKAISKQAQWALGLTGTPMGKEPSDLWPQYYLIDHGAALGPTLEFFRSIFYTQKKGFFKRYEFKFKKNMMPHLRRAMRHSSISYGIDELIDMPPLEWIPKNIPCPTDASGYCRKAIEAINTALIEKGKGAYREIESYYLQLRQLSSGYMTLKGEDDDRLQVQFEDNPKLDALMELVEGMPDGCKMVVFHHFIYTNQLISDRLKKDKIGHARVWSGQRDPIGQLRKFKDDPKCTVLVINSRSGSSSLNLQFANYVVFFEQPDSPIDRQQAERRVWRPGQDKRVFMFDLFVHDTWDRRIYNSNKAGENLLKTLLSGAVK